MSATEPQLEHNRYRLTRAQYNRAVGAGLVGAVELVDGAITLGGMRLPITVEWLRRAVDAGVIDEDARVELLNGELVAMTPANPPHSSMVRKLSRHLYQQLDATDFAILVQMPIEFGELSKPEPDLTVAKGPESDYDERDPTAPDVLLVVEVANTSLAKDRSEKLPIYARAGIREAWIVSLPERLIHVYRDPHLGQYQSAKSLDHGIVVPSESTLTAIAVDIDTLF
jgi:Uma2 family endonuclease